jgi:hypothetical protein
LTDDEGDDIFTEAFWRAPTSDETYPGQGLLSGSGIPVIALFVSNL